jgi:hypothetical protein
MRVLVNIFYPLIRDLILTVWTLCVKKIEEEQFRNEHYIINIYHYQSQKYIYSLGSYVIPWEFHVYFLKRGVPLSKLDGEFKNHG